MGETPVLREWDNLGVPVYLNVQCPTCRCEHPCDSICLRYGPKVWYCPACKVFKKHPPMAPLLRAAQAARLLKGLTNP